MTKRLETKYVDESLKFLLKNFDYQKQYSHIYSQRLSEVTALLVPFVEKKWGQKKYPIVKICDLREEFEETIIIIGTVYKHQVHKPSILRELSEENQLVPQPPRLNYSDPADKLILEDELQRVQLYGNVDINTMATGVVCAALGVFKEDGRFQVKDMQYLESGPQRPLQKLNKKRLLVLISGLNEMNSHKYADSINLFQYWLSGSIPSEGNKQIIRLIIAGNSIGNKVEEPSPSMKVVKNEDTGIVDSMLSLDTLLASWSRTVPVDIMPGRCDPSNFMLPQQPFHICMFPQASQRSSFRSVTNPYSCSIDDVSIIGCSGQNVNDLLRCTQLESSLEALRATLKFGHLAPTAPDTLACYPYLKSDPFILRECPHIYFTGNCNIFETDLHLGFMNQKTRLICVPDFSLTQSAAVVDLETLECHQINFKVN